MLLSTSAVAGYGCFCSHSLLVQKLSYPLNALVVEPVLCIRREAWMLLKSCFKATSQQRIGLLGFNLAVELREPYPVFHLRSGENWHMDFFPVAHLLYPLTQGALSLFCSLVK